MSVSGLGSDVLACFEWHFPASTQKLRQNISDSPFHAELDVMYESLILVTPQASVHPEVVNAFKVTGKTLPSWAEVAIQIPVSLKGHSTSVSFHIISK